MTDIAGTPSSSTILRWTTLIVVTANLAFIAVFNSVSETPTISRVLAGYADTLVPAEFARGIGVVMLVAVLFFYAAALLPSRGRRRTYGRLVLPLALSCVLASGWIVAFRHEGIGLSVAILAAIVALGGVMFARVAAVSPGKYSHWLRVPFSVHFAAMTIALLVVLMLWLNAIGVAADVAATAFLAVAVACGGFVAIRYCDFVYPAVIGAAAGAMFIAQHVIRPDIAVEGFIVCIGMLVVASLAAVLLARKSRREPKDRSSRSAQRVARRTPDESWLPIEGNASANHL
jgi:hypothetical protein